MSLEAISLTTMSAEALNLNLQAELLLYLISTVLSLLCPHIT